MLHSCWGCQLAAPPTLVLLARQISMKLVLPSASNAGLVQECYQPVKRCCSPVQVAALTLKWLALPAASEVAPYMPVDSQTLQLEGMDLQLKVGWPGVPCQCLLPRQRSSII